MRSFELGLQELSALCEYIKQQLPNGGVLILQGDLAAGKTSLTQAFARYLGEDERVTSATFSLQHRYGETLYHYDLYNKGLDHFVSLGLLEELEKAGWHFVEWGDENLRALLQSAGIETMQIRIEKLDNKRVYQCTH